MSEKQVHKWINTTPNMQFTPKPEAIQPQDVPLSYMSACAHCSSSAEKEKKEEEKVLLAAMQPQNFPKTINGQAVDSYWCFLCLFLCPFTQLKGGQSGLRFSDADLQSCGRKVCSRVHTCCPSTTGADM